MIFLCFSLFLSAVYILFSLSLFFKFFSFCDEVPSLNLHTFLFLSLYLYLTICFCGKVSILNFTVKPYLSLSIYLSLCICLTVSLFLSFTYTHSISLSLSLSPCQGWKPEISILEDNLSMVAIKGTIYQGEQVKINCPWNLLKNCKR